VSTVYLFGGSIAVLILVLIVGAIVVPKVRNAQRREALEQILERYQQALVRYVMLNRQCPEEVAYKHLVTFVKKRVPYSR